MKLVCTGGTLAYWREANSKRITQRTKVLSGYGKTPIPRGHRRILVTRYMAGFCNIRCFSLYQPGRCSAYRSRLLVLGNKTQDTINKTPDRRLLLLNTSTPLRATHPLRRTDSNPIAILPSQILACLVDSTTHARWMTASQLQFTLFHRVVELPP